MLPSSAYLWAAIYVVRDHRISRQMPYAPKRYHLFLNAFRIFELTLLECGRRAGPRKEILKATTLAWIEITLESLRSVLVAGLLPAGRSTPMNFGVTSRRYGLTDDTV